MQTRQVLLCGTAVPVCIVTAFGDWPMPNSQVFLGNQIKLLWKKVKDGTGTTWPHLSYPKPDNQALSIRSVLQIPTWGVWCLQHLTENLKFPWKRQKLCLKGKNTVHGGLSQCTWHCRTTAAWARVKLRVIHPFWTCSEIPGIWNHQLDFFFSMDLCILLYSHFHQIIRLELLQQSFLSILLERLFENFTFLRNFQMVD